MKRAYAKKTNQWVFFCTHTLVWKPLTHQYLRVCVCFYYVRSVLYAYKAVSNTPMRLKKRVGASNPKTCVFFLTLALFKTTRTHHILEVCVCFSDVNFLVYAWKCVSNTLIRINKLDVARKTNECVIFRTHAMFWKPRTHHMLRVCACFTNVHLVFYASLFVWNTLKRTNERAGTRNSIAFVFF